MHQRKQYESDEQQSKWQKVNIEKPQLFSHSKIESSSFKNIQTKTQKKANFKSPQSNNKALYEQTYFINGIRENHILLVSQNMQILELPMGLIQEQIKLGQPLKIKIEYDVKKHQQEENKIKNIQKELYKEFNQKRQ